MTVPRRDDSCEQLDRVLTCAVTWDAMQNTCCELPRRGQKTDDLCLLVAWNDRTEYTAGFNDVQSSIHDDYTELDSIFMEKL
mgnify:CR=1 FL=1